MTNPALNIFYILWSIQIVKAMFFWLYLWQLKEYHLKRLIDHFRTEKGKQIIFNPLQLFKIALLPALYFNQLLWLLAFIYGVEFISFAVKIAKKSVKKPVFTAKMIILILANLTIFAAILLCSGHLPKKQVIIVLVLADILLPLIISGIVLLLQPIAVLFRQQIISRAKAKRTEFKNLTVIGITGSYGKTSTKEFLYIILSEKFNVLKTTEHQNSEIAIARCILNDLEPEHQVFICEMGAYDKGKIKEVSGIVRPKIGIICGVNEQHLALFGSWENLISAEGGIELLQTLPDDGVAILNANSEKINSQFLISNFKSISNFQIKKTVFCSTKERLDLWAEDIKIEKDWLCFRVCDKTGESADFKINLVGGQNIENILLAVACAKELGMTLVEIATACEKIKPDQGAMKLVQSPTLNAQKSRTLDVIDSTYSANPDGVMAALEHLKLWPGKKIVIMPCLIELGPAAKEVHEKIGRKIGKICDFSIITTKDWFEEIKAAALNTGMKPENIIFSENSKEIFEKLKDFNKAEDIILLEGRAPQGLLDRFKNKTVPTI